MKGPSLLRSLKKTEERQLAGEQLGMGRGGRLCVFVPACNSLWVVFNCGNRGAAGSNRDGLKWPLDGSD